MALSVTDTCLVPIGDGGTLGYGKLSPVESHALQLRMLELLDLRAQIATLEKARSKETRERAKKADLRAVERRVRRSSAYGTPYRTG